MYFIEGQLFEVNFQIIEVSINMLMDRIKLSFLNWLRLRKYLLCNED